MSPWIGRRLWIVGIVGSLTITAAGCAVSGRSLRTTFDRENSSFTPASIQRFAGFPLYWAGLRFERWPLISIDGPQPPDQFITFIYGDCTPTGGDDEASCVPPIAIQAMPLCNHIDVVATNPIWRRRSIRGAPVGTIDSAPVLFSRAAQVKVYSGVEHDPTLALRVLRALRSANQVPPLLNSTQPIPAPSRGVLDGTRACTS
jgi:hypothetical protein